jgi:hypothetical protein
MFADLDKAEQFPDQSARRRVFDKNIGWQRFSGVWSSGTGLQPVHFHATVFTNGRWESADPARSWRRIGKEESVATLSRKVQDE